MATNSPGIGYRWVGEDELIETGDEFRTSRGKWVSTGYPDRRVTPRTAADKYRRKVKAPQFAPKYGYPLAPPCPVHVLWAESPWDSPVVQPATKPEPFPGEGYRLVEDGELIETGDQWWENGKWITTVFKTHQKMTKYGGLGVAPLRRKLPAPQYRPYADAAEAAKALEGKLIQRQQGDWHPVSRVADDYIVVGDLHPSFESLCDLWHFTDGTPCGVKIN